jgi:NAD-dependent oxidoreductase involved in siderophore biosynthesis
MAERGLSPEELARDCALEPTILRSVLLGDGGSTLAHIDRLLACLDVSLDDLLVEHPLCRQADLLGGRAQL